MDDSAIPYRIIRRPSFRQLTRLVSEADVIHIAGPCFVPLVLVWLLGKPAAVEHHGYQAACPNGLLLIDHATVPCARDISWQADIASVSLAIPAP